MRLATHRTFGIRNSEGSKGSASRVRSVSCSRRVLSRSTTSSVLGNKPSIDMGIPQFEPWTICSLLQSMLELEEEEEEIHPQISQPRDLGTPYCNFHHRLESPLPSFNPPPYSPLPPFEIPPCFLHAKKASLAPRDPPLRIRGVCV